MLKTGELVFTVKSLRSGSQVLQVGESKVTTSVSKLLHVEELRHLRQEHVI